jgi:two-component system sensor histidine kinase HydH
MQLSQKTSRLWTGGSIWIFIGTVLILIPVFIVLTVENINRQKENTVRLLVEEGAALIRSFEAGARTGMMGHMMGGFKIQRLLSETAQQPDIVYLLVTDAHGTILAHSDLDRVGHEHGNDLDFEQINQTKSVQWRRVKSGEGREAFEVYRRFEPTGPSWGRMGGRQVSPSHMMPAFPMGQRNSPGPQFIFVGLDNAAIIAAHEVDLRHTIVMAVVLLLVCVSGILLLFMTQGYRTTRASLARIKAFSDNLVENMPIGLIALDDRRRVASFNQVAQSILGFAPDAVIGRNADHVLPDEIYGVIDKLLPTGDVIEREIDCRLDSGDRVPLSVSASPLLDGNKHFLGFVLLLKDLREVHALRKEILRNQRLASVGRLAAGVAHEVRNPLSSIKGFATYFKERHPDRPEDQQIAGIMIQEIDRLNRVIGQLLDFARPIKITPLKVSMPQLIADALKLVEAQANEKKIHIEARTAERLREAAVDTDRINQVLLNLFLNALEAMENGGRLSVDADRDDEGRWIIIRVSDTGHGIPAQNLSKIFDPYYTTKSTGTGLGLAIAHNIVDAHGGRIDVTSTAGQGTTFTVRIPLTGQRDAK